MESILITGSYGQLGMACIKYLKLNFKLFISGRIVPNNGMQLDITNEKTVDQVLAETKPDIILNLAAMTDVDECENDPSMARAINVDGVKNLCNGFKGHFIQISTDYVFDGRAGPYSESDKTNPISVYGRTKLDADDWLRANHLGTTILRTNVLYSYTKLTQASFVKWVVDALSERKHIHVVDDQWNNPTWTESLAPLIENLIKVKAFDLFHYGDADRMNRYDFALIIAKVFDLDTTLVSPISTADLNQPAPRPLRSGLKTEKIESALGIVPNPVETCLEKIRKQLFK